MCPIQLPHVHSELVRQFIYCPRIPYFRLVLGIKRDSTAKMKQGMKKHEQVQEFIKFWNSQRKSLGDDSQIPWDRYLRYLEDSKVDVYLTDDQLGIGARVDLIHPIDEELLAVLHPSLKNDQKELEDLQAHLQECRNKQKYRVIELKFSQLIPTSRPFMSHRLQVALQALLVEAQWNACVPVGVIHFLPSHEERAFVITKRMKQFLLSQVEELRLMLEEEHVPPPTPHEKKCIDCEYWNACYRG